MSFRLPDRGKATSVGMVTLVNLTAEYPLRLKQIGEEINQHVLGGSGDQEALLSLVAQQDACMQGFRDAMSRAVKLYDELLVGGYK